MTSQKNIRDLAVNLKKVSDEMAKTFSDYQASTGLGCLKGCGRCCLNPDLDASTLDLIPIALKIYDEGKLDEWLTKVESPNQDHCLFYESHGNGLGQCGIYHERPSLCRMFGVAGYLTKEREVTLSICKFIIEEYPDEIPYVREDANLDETPIIAEWASKISTLGTPELNERSPINIALRKALHKISILAQYQSI